jgi:hypothetical protein
MAKRLSAREVNEKNTVEVDLGDGTSVLARKRSMDDLLFEGKLKMPLLLAVQRMVGLGEKASLMDRVQALGPQGEELAQVLRQHAVDVVLDPKMTTEKVSEHPDILSAWDVALPKLMLIWSATVTSPKVVADAADRFRRGARAHAAPAAPAGKRVRKAAKQLDRKRVEFAGR